ncbi:MAG TPA: hypothetical protein ENK02_08985 [Planctomycetes bacterium]|nr:hypothetical protein [Planctomycetota bacterium]
MPENTKPSSSAASLFPPNAACKRFLRYPPCPLLQFQNPALLPNKVLFATHTKALGENLDVSDGTPGGSGLLKDLHPAPFASSPRGFHQMGSRVFFGVFFEVSNAYVATFGDG